MRWPRPYRALYIDNYYYYEDGEQRGPEAEVAHRTEVNQQLLEHALARAQLVLAQAAAAPTTAHTCLYRRRASSR